MEDIKEEKTQSQVPVDAQWLRIEINNLGQVKLEHPQNLGTMQQLGILEIAKMVMYQKQMEAHAKAATARIQPPSQADIARVS